MAKAVTESKKVPLGCYLTPDELRDLHEYAARFEISVPNLCKLIIQRELCKPKLNTFRRRYFRKVGKGEGKRMTVKFANKAVKDRFASHVRECQLGSDDAVGILFRAEPREQWLRKAIGWPSGFVLESPGLDS